MAWSHCFQSGSSSKDSLAKHLRILVWLGHYVFEVHQWNTPWGFSKFLGDGLRCSNFFWPSHPWTKWGVSHFCLIHPGLGVQTLMRAQFRWCAGWDSGTSSTCTHQWRWAFSCLHVLSADTQFGGSLSSMVFSLHDAGHLINRDISPCTSLFLGLCSMSHICPRITMVQPMPGDMTCCPLRVVFVLDSQVNNLGDVSGFVWGCHLYCRLGLL